MATLVEMALEMVVARSKSTPLTADEMVSELRRFHGELKNLDVGIAATEEPRQEAQSVTALTQKDAFKRKEIACMICGKGGFKILTSHLRVAHGLKPREYKDMFGIPRKQSLTAKSYSDSRSKMAIESGMSAKLRAKKEAAGQVKVDGRKAKATAKLVTPTRTSSSTKGKTSGVVAISQPSAPAPARRGRKPAAITAPAE